MFPYANAGLVSVVVEAGCLAKAARKLFRLQGVRALLG
jgi:hypothetical protein